MQSRLSANPSSHAAMRKGCSHAWERIIHEMGRRWLGTADGGVTCRRLSAHMRPTWTAFPVVALLLSSGLACATKYGLCVEGDEAQPNVVVYNNVPSAVVQEACVQALAAMGMHFDRTNASEHDLFRMNHRKITGLSSIKYWFGVPDIVMKSACANGCVIGLSARSVNQSASLAKLMILEGDQRTLYRTSEAPGWRRPCVCMASNSAGQSLVGFFYELEDPDDEESRGQPGLLESERHARAIFSTVNHYVEEHAPR